MLVYQRVYLFYLTRDRKFATHTTASPQIEMVNFDGRQEVVCIKGANWFQVGGPENAARKFEKKTGRLTYGTCPHGGGWKIMFAF